MPSQLMKNRLPREVVDTVPNGTFEIRLGKALENIEYCSKHCCICSKPD